MTMQKHDRIWTLVHRLANAVTREDLVSKDLTLIVRLGNDELTVSYEPGMPIGVKTCHCPCKLDCEEAGECLRAMNVIA